jgi:hypothetical protein
MSLSPPKLPPVMGPDMRTLRRELVGASDERVLEVLRFVDTLPDRAAADGLLAPLRNRLRVLRPPRPLRFERLLMAPLNPVLVEPAAWRLGAPTLPRQAITPIAAHIREALPYIAAEVDRIGARKDESDTDRESAAGRILWSDAAAILRVSNVPAEWSTTGLPASTYRGMATGCAAVLGAAWRLHMLGDPGLPSAELNDYLNALLAECEPDGGVPWGMLLTVILQCFPQAEAPLHAATAQRANRDIRAAAEMALATSWAWIEAATADPVAGDAENLTDITTQLHHRIGLLMHLADDASHRKRAISLQAELRQASTRLFIMAVDSVMLAPVALLAGTDAVGDATVHDLEAGARAIRRLDFECRRLGGCGPAHDSRLNDAGAHIAACNALPPVDRARLIDILLGARAALKLLPAA